MNMPVIPWCVVNKGLDLIFWELVGLELINGGYSRPAVFCGSACRGTFNLPVRVLYYHGSWRSFSRCHRGYMPGLMGLKGHIESSTATLSAGGSTDQAAWRWGVAHPPLWSLGTGACRQPSHRIYSPHPWKEDTDRRDKFTSRCLIEA